ncbi:MAG: ABC transporter permease [Actinobacteria bacterium]|nr:ABC transporter permease [Actinomycetota bacterium]
MTTADSSVATGGTERSEQAAQSTRPKSSFRRFLRAKSVESSLTAVGFALIFAVYAVWLGSKFLNVEALLLNVHSNVPILILGLAVLVTLIGGQFDLSVAGMATLTTVLSIGLVSKQGLPFGLVLVICLAVGAFGGLVNGLVVERLGVNPFIATLGSGGVLAGIAQVYSGGTAVVPGPEGHQLPHWFTQMGTFGTKFPSAILWVAFALGMLGLYATLSGLRPASMAVNRWRVIRAVSLVVLVAILFVVFDLPKWIENTSWLLAIMLGIGLVMWTLLRLTTYGRYLKASGANREAATLAGVNVSREVIKAFVIGGLLAAIAGILLGASQGSAAPEIAAGFLLPAFAAAFLSTVIFSAGAFNVWGTILGGTVIVWVAQGLIIGGLPPTWSGVVNGTVLVVAVALSTVMRRVNR